MKSMVKSFKTILAAAILLLFLPLAVEALSISLGEKADFFIEPNYDLSQRTKISASLQRIGNNAYFYVDDAWWQDLDEQKEARVKEMLKALDRDFHSKIYPVLISILGSEWKPGIDDDTRITVLIHPMQETAGGYFKSADEYPKLQASNSNEREMVYLNALHITKPLIKSFLAHEFSHLITFYQKEKKQGLEEEIWLNEARAEAAVTLVGYDENFEGSNLQTRVKKFLERPTDSLTEWQGKSEDYGALNLFIQYLTDHYGIEILTDSLKSRKVGVHSLNEALEKNGFEETFSQIFTDWTIAILVNDCSLAPLDSKHFTPLDSEHLTGRAGAGAKFCYSNEDLKKVRVSPLINFLPLNGKSTLGITQSTKNWSGNWFKLIGGKGTLKIEFIGNPENLFRVPYVSQDFSGNYSLSYFQLDDYQRGEILIAQMGEKIRSITIIPSIQSKKSGFESPEPSFSYHWSASTITEEKPVTDSQLLEKSISQMSKQELFNKIAQIQQILAQLQTQLNQILSQESQGNLEALSCQRFEENLYFGLRNNPQVKCLQEFLKSQGEEIYPEGLVTGNFLSLTKAAVIRFQEKYAQDILTPWEISQGTGFVGKTTRAKLNELFGDR